MDDDRVVTVEVEDTYFQQPSVRASPISIVNSSSNSTRHTALRTAWPICASGTQCFRDGAPSLTQTISLV